MDTTLGRVTAAHQKFAETNRRLAATMRRVTASLRILGGHLARFSAGRAYGPQARPAELTVVRVRRGLNEVYGYTRAP